MGIELDANGAPRLPSKGNQVPRDLRPQTAENGEVEERLPISLQDNDNASEEAGTSTQNDTPENSSCSRSRPPASPAPPPLADEQSASMDIDPPPTIQVLEAPLLPIPNPASLRHAVVEHPQPVPGTSNALSSTPDGHSDLLMAGIRGLVADCMSRKAPLPVMEDPALQLEIARLEKQLAERQQENITLRSQVDDLSAKMAALEKLASTSIADLQAHCRALQEDAEKERRERNEMASVVRQLQKAHDPAGVERRIDDRLSGNMAAVRESVQIMVTDTVRRYLAEPQTTQVLVQSHTTEAMLSMPRNFEPPPYGRPQFSYGPQACVDLVSEASCY